MGAFGDKLRKQREQSGLALDAISKTTKISTRMLRALEEEHFDQLPGGVFNKGFVRAYARQVGLDEEETITDYLTALRESQVQSQKILPDFRGPGAKPNPVTPPDSRHHVLAASEHPAGDGRDNGSHDLPASERRRREERRNEVRRTQDRDRHDKPPVLAATRDEASVNAGGRGHGSPESASLMEKTRERDRAGEVQVESHRNEDQPRYGSSLLAGFITPAPTTESSNDSPDNASPRISKSMLAAAVILLLTLGLAVWNSQRHRDNPAESAAKPALPVNPPASSAPAQSAAPTLASASDPSPKAASASSSVKPAATKAPAATPSPSTKSSMPSLAPKPGANPPADPVVAKSTTHTLAATPASTFTLLIRAEQTTWISIIADGKPETHETLIAPAHTSVRASRDVAVKVGNAAGVSFQLNGKEFPAQGNTGEVRSYVFDAEGMRPGPPVASPAANR